MPVSAYVLWRTPFGLRLRSVGEKPAAADSLGVAVYRMKYIGVTISGMLAGLGGAWLAIDIRAYNQGQTAGRGFQGLAALIFGNWRPAGIGAGAGLLRLRPGADPADRYEHRCGRCSSWARSWPPGWRIWLYHQRRAPQAVGALIMGALSLIYYLEHRRRSTTGSSSSRRTW